MLTEQEQNLLITWSSLRARYRERDDRIARTDAVITGDFAVVDPDNKDIVSRSPNLIQVALEDTAEAAGTMPTIRVIPRRNISTIKATANRMEQVAAGYFDHSQMDLLVIQSVMDMAAFGLGVWVVWPDFDERLPIIEKRDPRTCYPEPGLRAGSVQRCMFSRQVHYTQLPAAYQHKLQDFITTDGTINTERLSVNLVEYFTEDKVTVAAIYEGQQGQAFTMGSSITSQYTPVILDEFENRTGVCPVVIGTRFSLDGEHRGQFDQVVGVLEAHVRLMSMILDYADQAVYSDVWVKDLIGEMSWGGGAYIELGPQGGIGRVPPAVSSLNVQDDLDRLVDSIHVGGRWPKSRPGEIDQAIASAKFVEATAGMLNTAIKTYHQILQRMMEHSIRLAFITDQKYFPGKKTISGILRNQEFVEEYDPSKDIDTGNRIRAEYGIGLGRDPAQSAVLMIQYAKEGYVSNEFVQENIEGLSDVGRERVRLDVDKFNSMMMAKLLQGVQDGSLSDAALVDLAEARAKGDSLEAIYRKYIVEPAEQQPAPVGLQGAGPPQGGPEGPPGAAPPPGQPPGQPALTPPPAPAADSVMARLGVPAGNRNSFLSVGG